MLNGIAATADIRRVELVFGLVEDACGIAVGPAGVQMRPAPLFGGPVIGHFEGFSFGVCDLVVAGFGIAKYVGVFAIRFAGLFVEYGQLGLDLGQFALQFGLFLGAQHGVCAQPFGRLAGILGGVFLLILGGFLVGYLLEFTQGERCLEFAALHFQYPGGTVVLDRLLRGVGPGFAGFVAGHGVGQQLRQRVLGQVVLERFVFVEVVGSCGFSFVVVQFDAVHGLGLFGQAGGQAVECIYDVGIFVGVFFSRVPFDGTVGFAAVVGVGIGKSGKVGHFNLRFRSFGFVVTGQGIFKFIRRAGKKVLRVFVFGIVAAIAGTRTGDDRPDTAQPCGDAVAVVVGWFRLGRLGLRRRQILERDRHLGRGLGGFGLRDFVGGGGFVDGGGCWRVFGLGLAGID